MYKVWGAGRYKRVGIPLEMTIFFVFALPNVQRTFASKGGRWFWSQYRHEFENEFAKEIDRIIEN